MYVSLESVETPLNVDDTYEMTCAWMTLVAAPCENVVVCVRREEDSKIGDPQELVSSNSSTRSL